MSLSTVTIDVQSRFGVTVHNELLVNDPPVSRLLILLPGRGYTINHPLLHYTRMAGLYRGWDVLSVQYGFQVSGGDFGPQQVPDLWYDVQPAVENALKRGYQQVCIAGKSLGTPLAAQLANSLDLPHACIMLTPIRDAVNMVENVPTLALIGTADAVYDAEKTVDSETVTWHVYNGLNHSLEKRADLAASINALNDIIAEIDHFLETL